MKDLNFKAWNIEEQKMHYISLIDFINGGYWVQTAQCSECGFWVYPPAEFVLLQGTPFKDMDGELIYEGDLISNNFGTKEEVIREVVFENGCWTAKKIKGYHRLRENILLFELEGLNYKIIGNKIIK